MRPAAWIWLRRASQVTFFLVAGALVAATTYPLGRALPYDIIPRFSPLLALTAMAASRALVAAFWPALLTVALTLLFGRAFCGWVCPLGAALDGADALISKRKKEGDKPRRRHWRLLLLVVLLLLSAFGIAAAGWLDPLSLFPRTLAAAFIPYVTLAFDGATRLLYRLGVWEDAAAALRQRFLVENVSAFPGHLVVSTLFVAIIFLGLARRRFYCRYLCPAGALLSVVGWASPFGRRVSSACSDCNTCLHICRMGAIGARGRATATAECTLCMDCLAACPGDAVSFGFGRRRAADNPTSWAPAMTRRGFLVTTGATLAASPAALALDSRITPHPYLIRPPGAVTEEGEFLARCVRCGECVRVCLTQGLVPVHFEAGLTGLWTPTLAPRRGYCEYRCTLCTEVCPTDAIKLLSEEQKKKEIIGVVIIDRDRCLPWADDEDCNVCEEMCPTAPKAIELKGPGRLKPHVVVDECVGCGICEYACPTADPAAIRVVGDRSREFAEIVAGRRNTYFGQGREPQGRREVNVN